jgi:SagB-type dehydrogenase family enzyme
VTYAGHRFRRARYLVLYWAGSDAVLMDAHTLACTDAPSSLVALLSGLTAWSSAEDLRAAGMPLEEADLQQLAKAGLLEAEDERPVGKPSQFAWDPLELAVQRKTAFGGARVERMGSAPNIGARFEGRPVVALPSAGPLPAMTLETALQRRRSVRTYGSQPLRLEDLSALLHHSARVIERRSDGLLGDREFRPFPTAGARSELNIYLVVDGVAGLEPGAYHYDHPGHRLRALRGKDDHHRRILRSVHSMAGGMLNRDPAVVLLVTAVFERIMWKYRNLGLSLIYKDVGALFQTLYLVATALELAPCALGGGEEAENSRWLGLDPLQESQVGCFLVGTRSARERNHPSTMGHDLEARG